MPDGKDLSEELKAKLQKIADDNDVLVMSFIAPDTIVRKSPVAYAYAKITLDDLYKVEKEIENLKTSANLPKKLHLIIHTPGGRVDATTKIARYLRGAFDEIEAYVPYEAASGGTVLCLAANCIVMGDTSNLTPIDPQIKYKGETVSAVSYEQAIDDMTEKYPTSSPDEIPSPDQQKSNKFDPIIAKEFSKVVLDSLMVAVELLDASQSPKKQEDKNKIYRAAFSLTKTVYPHSHQFNAKRARDIGLTISADVDKMGLLKTYREWVSCKLNEKVTTHIIETYVPKKDIPNDSTNKTTESGPKVSSKKSKRVEKQPK